MKIRAHRALLEEATQTSQDIEPTKEAVLAYLMTTEYLTVADMFRPDFFTPENLEVKPYGYDHRIGWNTHVVLLGGDAVGFTDGPLKDL